MPLLLPLVAVSNCRHGATVDDAGGAKKKISLKNANGMKVATLI